MASGAAATLTLRGAREIEWPRPDRCPKDFEPQRVYLGRDESPGGQPIEVATARWNRADRIPRDALARLHALRLNNRAVPLVLVALRSDGQVTVFGPNPSSAPIDPIPAEQAERFLQAVLDEPTAQLARARVAALAQAIDSMAMPGIKNSGLFANHELRTGVPQRADWKDACRSSAPLLVERGTALVRGLGYSAARLGAHALVLTGKGARPDAIAVMLDDGEAFDAESSRFAISPVAYGLTMAQREGVPWLILLRGSQLRLYPARIDLGVGRKGLAETFCEVDLPHLTVENAGYVSLIFSADALAEGGSAFEILGSSAQYAVRLGARLRDKVYEQIVPELSLAVAKQMTALGHAMDAAGLDLAYQVTLRVFFRLLFQVYAEDRKLLPFGENARYDRNALKTVAQDLVEDPGQEFDPESGSLWDDLAQVWRVIDEGDRAWGVPPYNGGLFASDPELNEFGALIGRLRITNDVMGPALRALLLDEDEEGAIGPIDFRSLSVREFGTIYEGLLESSLGLAEVDLTLDEKGTWLPAKAGDEVFARAGEVYFHNTSGQRKGTGSYFTPSFVVEHLLERALDPALDDHLAKVAEFLKKGDEASATELFFDFKVADLAMGSGHFLTAAIDHIEARMAAFLAEENHRIPGVVKEIALLHEAAKQAVGPDAPEPEPSSLLRRQIARRCIYGLDINPIAVELARVSIWIHTFVRGLPMSSLDHNLVCANSLTGIGSVDEALDVLVSGRKKGAASLFDAPIEEALTRARTVLVDVANLPEVDRNETREATRKIRKARQEAETAKLLFDAAVLRRIGRGELVPGAEVEEIAAQAATPEAQAELDGLQPGHMPVLFPEVFLRENAGFDVLIGNPPWEELMLDEVKFWLRYSPGLLGRPIAERRREVERLKGARPELVVEFKHESDRIDQTRAVLLAGTFPGLGTGDVDLYRVFAWRMWDALRVSGCMGAVFPRTLLNSAGGSIWRDRILSCGDVSVVTVINRNGWVFSGVDGRYSIALVDIRKKSAVTARSEVRLSGPFNEREAFDAGREDCGVLAADVLQSASRGAAFPQLPGAVSVDVFTRMRMSPSLEGGVGPSKFVPVREFDATLDKRIFDAGGEEHGRWPVYGGASFNIWQPESGEVYAWSDPDVVKDALFRKRLRQIGLKKSAFYGLSADWASSESTLACLSPRIAYRQITNATNSRTVIAALIPGYRVLTNAAPYFLRREGGSREEAFLLGIMCSVPFDWYARRFVELNFNFHIVHAMPVPPFGNDGARENRVVTLAGRLAARDDRFAEWATAVGVPVGSVASAEQQADMEAEIDALVSHLYGLERHHVEHIFETFHRGWDYRPRLDAVLAHYDRIGAA